MTSLLVYDYNKTCLSKRGQRFVDLATGELTWGMTVALCREIGKLDEQERGAVFVVLKRLLDPERYAQLHGHYIRFVLGHRWGR